MEPKLVTKPAFTVVGLRTRAKGGSQAFAGLWEQFVPRMGEIKHTAAEDASYGVMDNADMATMDIDYMAGNPVTAAADLPQGMSAWQVPANTYAVFATTLPKIGETFDHIFGTWLPASDYRQAAGPYFERYGEDFAPDTPHVDIYIPVEKKS
jgi:AraC family transcriptional regulator